MNDNRIKVLKSWVAIDAQVSANRFYVDAKMSPVNIDGLITISESASNTKVGPQFLVDLSSLPLRALIKIKGFLKIPMLGLAASADVSLDNSGVSCTLSKTILGGLHSEVSFGWKWSLNKPQMHFKAAVKVDSFRSIVGNVLKSIQGAVNGAQKFVTDLKKKITEAHNAAENMCSALRKKGKINSVVEKGCKVLSGAVKKT